MFDQSKDHSLKDFIGHKYSSIVSFHTPVSTEGGRVPEHAILDADATLDGEKVSAILYSNYIATIYGETLETLSYQSGDTITIDVNFEYIKYTVNPTLTDTASGYFSVSTNPGTDHSKILKDLTIDTTGNQNSHKIDYYAYAGYEFDTEAFKIKATYNALTKEQTLSEYNPTTLTLSVGEAQAYTLTLDADWLIDNFYSLVCNNYDVEATNLGIISINTKKIDFTFGYKLFDGTTTSNKGIIGEITRTLEDNENNIGETIEGLVSSQLTTSADKGDIIRYADVDYALLTSMLYCENIDPYNTDLQNNLARYPFKLDKSKIANDKLLLTSSAISFMTGAEDGIILPLAKRALYVLLDVRPILELKVTLVDDSNFTDNPMISARV